MARIGYTAPGALGDALPADVKSPKTFSSMAAGINKTGVYVPTPAVNSVQHSNNNLSGTVAVGQRSTIWTGNPAVMDSIVYLVIRFSPHADGNSFITWWHADGNETVIIDNSLNVSVFNYLNYPLQLISLEVIYTF